jgi:hypothetical protein
MTTFNEDFRDYCRTLTDAQLENVLWKEWEAGNRDEDRLLDYQAAKMEAQRRGWDVWRGERR